MDALLVLEQYKASHRKAQNSQYIKCSQGDYQHVVAKAYVRQSIHRLSIFVA